MNIRKFRNDTFFFDVTILWPVTPQEFQDYVQKNFDANFDDVGDFKAICVENKSDDVILGFKQWNFSDSDFGNLTHECLHATVAMLEERGIMLSEETEECYCYLQNSLFENCLKAMRS